jgi:hypothetical protein
LAYYLSIDVYSTPVNKNLTNTQQNLDGERINMSAVPEKTKIIDGLLKLAEQGSCRNKSSQLRVLLPSINQAQVSGISNKQIVDFLAANGLIMTLKTFETLLCRIRKEKTSHAPHQLTLGKPVEGTPRIRAPPIKSIDHDAEKITRGEFFRLSNQVHEFDDLI